MMILVTGATSGLGRNAVQALADAGQGVRATGRNAEQGEALRRLGIPFEAADLAHLGTAQADALLCGVDTVWHCAALSSPWGRYEDFLAANVHATRRLAHAAVQRGVRRFVHISTPSIYFDYQHHHDVPENYRARRYANHYAATKALAEQEIQRLAAAHPATTFVILRPRGLFGPHDRVVLPRILQVLRARRGTLPLPRGGQACIDLTYVMNVVHAMELATGASAIRSGAAYNITNQAPDSLASLLSQLLRDELGMACRVKSVPYWLMDSAARGLEAWARCAGREPMLTRYSVGTLHFDMTLSNLKAQKELGYFPRYGMADGIRRTAQWIREHGAHHRI